MSRRSSLVRPLLLAAQATSCAEEERPAAPAPAETFEAPVVLRSLWTEEEALEVLRESEEDPV